MLDSFLSLFQQFDTSMLGDLSELDWTNIATYGALTVAFAGIVWTSSKKFVRFLWQKAEGVIGFATSTLVVVALWYTLLRVHVSISFNLDKEIFDDLLWFSAILFTPYYLLHYNLLTGFVLSVVRSGELLLDLLVFSWFPQKAEQNREKWKTRTGNVYQTWKDSINSLRGPKASQMSSLDVNQRSESTPSETSEPNSSAGNDGTPAEAG